MPHLRTDDGPRKLRAVWLGPKGATLPFEWTYVQWAAVLIGIVVAPMLLGPVVYLVTGLDAGWGVVLRQGSCRISGFESDHTVGVWLTRE